MKRNPNKAFLASALFLALALPGCSKKPEQPPVPPPSQAPKLKPVGAPAAPVQKQVSSAQASMPPLDFSRRLDPFKPYAPPVAPKAQALAQPGRSQGDRLPIQSFEVSQFKVVGIVAGLKANRALVLDPNGKGYVIQEGMQIGSNEGRVTRITAASVEVAERVREDNGRIRKRTIVLTLTKKR